VATLNSNFKCRFRMIASMTVSNFVTNLSGINISRGSLILGHGVYIWCKVNTVCICQIYLAVVENDHVLRFGKIVWH